VVGVTESDGPRLDSHGSVPKIFFYLFISLGLRRYLTVTKIPELYFFHLMTLLPQLNNATNNGVAPIRLVDDIIRLQVCPSVRLCQLIPTWICLREMRGLSLTFIYVCFFNPTRIEVAQWYGSGQSE
jgi:hypothetical protein